MVSILWPGEREFMKRISRFVLLLTMSLFLCCSAPDSTNLLLSGSEGTETVAILETSEGRIVLSFFVEQAPIHSENFARLCDSGFYDGTYFHRVAAGFMIQGGDPNTKDEDPSNDGKGGHSFLGPGTTLEPEFNEVRHRRGIVSMSRASDPSTAGSQFFILLTEESALDGNYTAFAEVLEGIEVVDAIAERQGEPFPAEGGVRPDEDQHVIACWLEQRPSL